MRSFFLSAGLGLCVPLVHGQFADEHIITPLERMIHPMAGDVDNDGLTDLVSCGMEGPIFLYRGAGNGAFSAPEIIGLHGYYTEEQCGLVDVDGDQDLDLLYHDGFDAMRLLRNDGSGAFAPAEDLFFVYAYVNDGMHFRDLDGDDDVDIVFSRDNISNQQIVWYANNGSGAFSSMGVVASATNACFWVRPADLDGDGDMDLITSRTTDDNILRYDNDGSGSFSPATVMTSGSLESLHRVRTADLNMDGRDDICFSDGEARVRLLLSDSTGFQAPVLLYTAQGYALIGDIRLSDMDANGTTDVVFGADELIGYFSNPGNGSFPIVPDTLIDFPYSTVDDVFITSDLDNNGVQDIALRATRTLVYFPDQGGGAMLHPKAVSRGMSQGSLLMADLDQDGDPDALSAESYLYNAGGTLLFAAYNDGSGVFARPDTIANIGLDLGWAHEPWQLHDMDDDGDQDLLLMDDHYYSLTHLSWLANNGSGHYDSLVVVLENALTYELVDLDMDGEEDLIVINTTLGSHVGWFRGLGAGHFSNFIDLGSLPEAQDVAVGDPDQDGDLDIMTTSGSGQYVYGGIYANQGNAAFALHQLLFTTSYGGELQLADLDGDQLPDAFITTSFSNGIVWYKNLGGLQFSFAENLINADGIEPTLTDMDDDGDLDVLYSMDQSSSISWLQNLGAGEFAPSADVAVVHGEPSRVHLVDVDGDGLRDLAYCLIPDSTSGPYAYTPGWIGGTGLPLAAPAITEAAASVFPLPFTHSATIHLPEPLLANEQLVLIDGTGRIVRVLPGSGSDHMTLERGDLVTGLYLLQKRSVKGIVLVGRALVE